MHKLYVFVLFFITLFITLFSAQPALAVTVTDPPVPVSYAPVFISGFQITDQLDVIELYNESSDPVDLSLWSIQYQSLTVGEICKISLQDWILPSGYTVSVAKDGILKSLAEANTNVRLYDSCIRSLGSDFIITLNYNEIIQETITPTEGAFVRKGLTKTYRTGKFSTDFIAINRSLYAGELYTPPEFSQLQISEILIDSRNCSPLETAIDCNDYVKLYNPTELSIDLSLFRIRNGYLGQAPSTSNTTELEGIVEAGHYIIIPMTVTNSASWLWLEDVYGVKRYDNTVQDYLDGSSDTKKGQAWAYDLTDDSWKWTPQPTPFDAPSIFPIILPNPEPIVEVTTSFVPCAEGQYRSEETNRCRSVVSEVASLIPCGPGQERNPETNRCRSTTSALGVSDLVPCKAGQERNPDTNRCRNIASTIPQAEYQPQQTSENSNNFILWLSLAVVGLLALGYAVWEWRTEISHIMQKIGAFLKSRK